MCHCPTETAAAAAVAGVSGGAALRALLDKAADLLLSPGEPDVPLLSDSDLLAWFDGDAEEDGCSGDGRARACETCRSSSDSAELPLPAYAERVDAGGEGKESGARGRKDGRNGGPTPPCKRARNTASNSQYERKRRGRINQRIRALGRLLPNFRESDRKESLLDKAIDHIKELQAEGRMMCAMMVPPPNLQAAAQNGIGQQKNGAGSVVLPTMFRPQVLVPLLGYPSVGAAAVTAAQHPFSVGFYQQPMYPSGFYPDMGMMRVWPTSSASM